MHWTSILFNLMTAHVFPPTRATLLATLFSDKKQSVVLLFD